MSEIEKLYENAGIELGCCKYAEYGYEGEEGTWYYCIKENKECWTYPNGDADCVEKGYPQFTAEKVLKIIVFFLNKGIRLDFSVKENTRISVENFKECIAQIGAKYWQDLTEEEKQQIKEILE